MNIEYTPPPPVRVRLDPPTIFRYDFPWQLHNLVPLGILGGPPRHDRHHREGGVYLQKFGTYLDEAFGFVPGDRGRCKGRGRGARTSVARRVLTAVSWGQTQRKATL